MIKITTNIASTAWDTFYINNNWIENPNSLLSQGVKQTHIADSALISAKALLLGGCPRTRIEMKMPEIL